HSDLRLFTGHVLWPHTNSIDYRPELELRAAAAVHPNAVGVVAPRPAIVAVGFADLPRKNDSVASVSLAIFAAALVRRAGDNTGSPVPCAISFTARAADLVFGATAPVDPNAASVVAPSAVHLARRAADLTYQPHAASGVGGAVFTLVLIIGGAHEP